MFQPPLSSGLLWYKVYIYSKSISHKIWTNLAQKIRFWNMLMRQFGPWIPPFGRRFFARARLKKPVSIRAPDNTIRAPNWQFPKISISPILSHFHNTHLTTCHTKIMYQPHLPPFLHGLGPDFSQSLSNPAYVQP